MARWSNPPLTLYHGTHRTAVGAIPGLPRGAPMTIFVPDLSRSRRNTDFGLGFYTTTNLQQAEQWANKRVQRSSSVSFAVVIGFNARATRWRVLRHSSS